MSEEPKALLPCPFCGGTPRIIRNASIGSVECPCDRSMSCETTIEHAIMRWNERSPGSEAEAIEAVVEAARNSKAMRGGQDMELWGALDKLDALRAVEKPKSDAGRGEI